MISHRYRCIFVHIPKTGGTSIEDVIWPGPRSESDLWMGFVTPFRNKYQTGGLQHLKASQIRAEVGDEVFRSYFKFAIVRNPWDRLVSQFSYLQGRPDLQNYLGLAADAGFAQYLDAARRTDHVQLISQSEFLFDEDGNTSVDFVGHFETLAQDAATIFERIGLASTELPHKNASTREGDYRKYYDEATRTIAASLYAQDIANFGYQF